MTSQKSGGRHPEPFIFEHFTKVGAMNSSTKKWNVRCNYCPPNALLILHRDNRCLNHLTDKCANVPKVVKEAAQLKVMQKGGLEIVIPGSDDEIESVPDSDAGSTSTQASKRTKFSKSASPSVGAGKRTLETFLERSLTKEEENRSNVHMLRFFIHGNIPFAASSNPFLIKWVQSLRPSYTPAS
ncbi:hypothetical protein CPB83DRAFT_743688, partial [Crepidotus variabilis]